MTLMETIRVNADKSFSRLENFLAAKFLASVLLSLISTIALQTLTEAKTQSNERMVLLKQGSEFVLHKVKIGLSNFKQTEILSGLTEDNILGVPITSRLKVENDWRENRIKSSRSFGTIKRKTSP